MREVPAYHLPEPLPLHWNRVMHAPPKRLLDLPEFLPHAVATSLPLKLESTAT
ncbi:hypothetical protein SAMN05192563_1024177 [Paraburkholderia aspalathi]|uniref:Uncharacterized protein n=1 Tax=Paraburkholderia aspalathi TaxID=1324617 RepID=A0A1I7EJL9_9BURK|nr:hypothetical protein SAMN05192563_1024177 [Paraburkholderia aspalathi]